MAWIYKQRGSENWWIGYRLNGKQYLRSTGTSKKEEAERELARLEQIGLAHKSGNLTEEFFRLITNANHSNETLRGFVKQWLKECKDLSSVTLTRYADALEEFCLHINATDAAPLLRDVRTETIAGFIRQKRASTSTATARLYRKILSAFFSYSVDNQVLQINPVPRAKSLKLTKDSEAVRRAFTLKELKTLYEKAPSDFWRWMVLAGFYMGQRMGDLITLPWAAVDFEQGVIRLKARKTGRPMQIPLRAELRAFLLKRRKAAGDVKSPDPIWPDESARYEQHGAGVFSNEFYDDVLLPAGLVTKRSKNAAKDAEGKKVLKHGRQVNPVSFHCLRHTFVSLLKVSGGSQSVAKELAGHSSDAVSDLYTHVPEEVLTKAIDRLPEVTK
jgi:integrase